MLSYRHGFHAGNHADVLKHFCLYLILEHYRRKALPYLYFDVHAGAALYDLNSAEAQKTGEHRDGIQRLSAPGLDLPPPLRDFVALWQQSCPAGHYWGSPYLAAQLRLPDSKMRLCELHPREALRLRQSMQSLRLGRACKILGGDGLQQLLGSLPPTPRRGLILIDPPYELKDEYRRVLHSLSEAVKRFAEGCFMLWYPLLNKPEMQRFERQLPPLAPRFLQLRLQVRRPRPDGMGMHGSALFIVNPPYLLAEALRSCLDDLCRILAQDAQASWQMETRDA